MTTSEFVKQFRESDPRKLALQASRYPDVDMPYALNQIQGWQTAQRKLPSWAACDGVVYPPHLNMEQCSSEATARYKQQVARRWAERIPNASRTSMTDLTGGFGVDFSFTSRCFDCATYVERNASLCEVVGANLPRLGIRNAQVKCAEAEAVLEQLEPQTMIFLDPARRDEHGAKTVLIADCTPDVCQLLPSLMQKSQFVMLKLSPMLDWHKAIVDLDGKVREVHIVSADGECKELLLVLASDGKPEVQVFCVDIQSRPDSEGQYPRSEFVYSIGGEAEPQPTNSQFTIQQLKIAAGNNSKLKIKNSKFCPAGQKLAAVMAEMRELAHHGRRDAVQSRLGKQNDGLYAGEPSVDVGLLALELKVAHRAHSFDDELGVEALGEVDRQVAVLLHADTWLVAIERAYGVNALVGGEHIAFALVDAYAYHKMVEQGEGAAHD